VAETKTQKPDVPAMKVRIGYRLGTRTRLNEGGFTTVVDTLERLRFDSLWLSEVIGGNAPDPSLRCRSRPGARSD